MSYVAAPVSKLYLWVRCTHLWPSVTVCHVPFVSHDETRHIKLWWQSRSLGRALASFIESIHRDDEMPFLKTIWGQSLDFIQEHNTVADKVNVVSVRNIV